MHIIILKLCKNILNNLVCEVSQGIDRAMNQGLPSINNYLLNKYTV